MALRAPLELGGLEITSLPKEASFLVHTSSPISLEVEEFPRAQDAFAAPDDEGRVRTAFVRSAPKLEEYPRYDGRPHSDLFLFFWQLHHLHWDRKVTQHEIIARFEQILEGPAHNWYDLAVTILPNHDLTAWARAMFKKFHGPKWKRYIANQLAGCAFPESVPCDIGRGEAATNFITRFWKLTSLLIKDLTVYTFYPLLLEKIPPWTHFLLLTAFEARFRSWDDPDPDEFLQLFGNIFSAISGTGPPLDDPHWEINEFRTVANKDRQMWIDEQHHAAQSALSSTSPKDGQPTHTLGARASFSKGREEQPRTPTQSSFPKVRDKAQPREKMVTPNLTRSPGIECFGCYNFGHMTSEPECPLNGERIATAAQDTADEASNESSLARTHESSDNEFTRAHESSDNEFARAHESSVNEFARAHEPEEKEQAETSSESDFSTELRSVARPYAQGPEGKEKTESPGDSVISTERRSAVARAHTQEHENEEAETFSDSDLSAERRPVAPIHRQAVYTKRSTAIGAAKKKAHTSAIGVLPPPVCADVSPYMDGSTQRICSCLPAFEPFDPGGSSCVNHSENALHDPSDDSSYSSLNKGSFVPITTLLSGPDRDSAPNSPSSEALNLDLAHISTKYFLFQDLPNKLKTGASRFRVKEMIGPNTVRLELEPPYDRKHNVFPVSLVKLHQRLSPETFSGRREELPTQLRLRGVVQDLGERWVTTEILGESLRKNVLGQKSASLPRPLGRHRPSLKRAVVALLDSRARSRRLLAPERASSQAPRRAETRARPSHSTSSPLQALTR